MNDLQKSITTFSIPAIFILNIIIFGFLILDSKKTNKESAPPVLQPPVYQKPSVSARETILFEKTGIKLNNMRLTSALPSVPMITALDEKNRMVIVFLDETMTPRLFRSDVSFKEVKIPAPQADKPK